jgi:hypothetical protein
MKTVKTILHQVRGCPTGIQYNADTSKTNVKIKNNKLHFTPYNFYGNSLSAE